MSKHDLDALDPKYSSFEQLTVKAGAEHFDDPARKVMSIGQNFVKVFSRGCLSDKVGDTFRPFQMT